MTFPYLRHGRDRLETGLWPFELTSPDIRRACLEAGDRSARDRGLSSWDEQCWQVASDVFDRMWGPPPPEGG